MGARPKIVAVSDRASRAPRRAALFVVGLLLLAIFLVFGRSVAHDFVNYDDPLYVSATPQVTGGFSLEGVGWAFTTTRAGNWHPLTWLSLMLDGQLYGREAWGYHLTNVLLHAAAAVTLFLVLQSIRHTSRAVPRGRHTPCAVTFWPAAFAAVVFAVHPLRAESVAWVSERKDVLSGLLFMLTLAAYLGYVRRPFSLVRYLAVILLFALALMAKPAVVTLPFVLLLLDYWPLGRREAGTLIEKLPLFALAAASCVATYWAQGPSVVALETIPLHLRIANSLVSYVVYLVQFFYPAGLAAFYPFPAFDLPLAFWKPVAAALLLIAISTTAIGWRRKLPYLFVGWFWYLGMLVPMIGLVQVGVQAHADRYTYLPQIGLCIAVAWCLVWQTFLSATRTGGQTFLSVKRTGGRAFLSVVVLTALMVCAWRQTSYWRDSETLWEHALRCTPRNARARNGLGNALFARKQFERAVQQYEAALAINGKYNEAQDNLRIAKAEVQFRLAAALADRGELDGAVRHYRSALELRPDYVDAHYNLGFVLSRQGRTAEAVAQWREALRLRPDDLDSLDQLAWALATCGEASIRNGAEAVTLAGRAVGLTNGRDADVLATLAAAYAEAGRFAEAVAAAERAISLAAAAGNTAAADAYRARLHLYRTGQPYHEPAQRPATNR
jgi:protein O-mannosyl-transferase